MSADVYTFPRIQTAGQPTMLSAKLVLRLELLGKIEPKKATEEDKHCTDSNSQQILKMFLYSIEYKTSSIEYKTSLIFAVSFYIQLNIKHL